MRNQQQYLKKVTHFYDEHSNQYLPVIDRTKWFKEKSYRSSTRSFLLQRKQKHRLIKKETRLLQRTKKLPTPGGVEYGVYYFNAFYQDFIDFAVLDFVILVPASARGHHVITLYRAALNVIPHNDES